MKFKKGVLYKLTIADHYSGSIKDTGKAQTLGVVGAYLGSFRAQNISYVMFANWWDADEVKDPEYMGMDVAFVLKTAILKAKAVQ